MAKPGSVRCSRRKLLASSPADDEQHQRQRHLRDHERRAGPRAAACRRGDHRSRSVRSTRSPREAWSAGTRPNRSALASDTSRETSGDPRSSPISSTRGTPSGSTGPAGHGPRRRGASRAMPPAIASTRLSVSSWRTSRAARWRRARRGSRARAPPATRGPAAGSRRWRRRSAARRRRRRAEPAAPGARRRRSARAAARRDAARRCVRCWGYDRHVGRDRGHSACACASVTPGFSRAMARKYWTSRCVEQVPSTSIGGGGTGAARGATPVPRAASRSPPASRRRPCGHAVDPQQPADHRRVRAEACRCQRRALITATGAARSPSSARDERAAHAAAAYAEHVEVVDRHQRAA